MKRSKRAVWKYGIIFPVILLAVIFAIKKENKLQPAINPRIAEWPTEQDDAAVLGSNLFYGSSTVEGGGFVYTLNIGKYGGEPAQEDEGYNIYRLKEGEWELFVTDGFRSPTISHLVYMDGYIYYVLKEKGWGDPTDEYCSIFRASEEGGGPERLGDCDTNFYIYEGEIYFKRHKKGIRYFCKMKPDGEDIEELYSDDQQDVADFDYTVGGGCLYLKDEKHILGINLKTGKRKFFKTEAEHIRGMFYENDRLYIYDAENSEVYQIDVKTGDESKIIEGKLLQDCLWIHDGYLYYVEGENEPERFHCDLKAMNLKTGEVSLWKSASFEIQPCDAVLEVVGNRVTADFCAKNESGTGEYKYYEKEIREITDSGYKKGKEDEERIIAVQGDEWQVEQDDEPAIGYSLGKMSTEGNGCIYTTDMGMYGGEPPDVDYNIYWLYNIYRLKEGKWELFVSQPSDDEDYYMTSIRDLVYKDGYIYYRLEKRVVDGSPLGTFIYRASEQDGSIEKLAECDNSSFYIYKDKIYYSDEKKGLQFYYRMKPDGSDKEQIYFDSKENYPREESTYTVGGDCLYIVRDEHWITGINLETGKKRVIKYFDLPSDEYNEYSYISDIFYKDGKLYMQDLADKSFGFYQMDVKTGNMSKISEFNMHNGWIYDGCQYYMSYETTEKGENYEFKVRDLSTGKVVTWGSVFLENVNVYRSNESTAHIEVTAGRVIIIIGITDGSKVVEYRYFVKEISEIMEMDWST